MKGTTKIKNLGTVVLDSVSVDNGQIEVHVPIDDITEQLDGVIDKCMADFMGKHENVKSSDELVFDVRVVFSFGNFKDNTEFSLFIIVWNESDDEAEFYEEIPVSFDEEDSKKIKKIIWDGLGESLFGL